MYGVDQPQDYFTRMMGLQGVKVVATYSGVQMAGGHSSFTLYALTRTVPAPVSYSTSRWHCFAGLLVNVHVCKQYV